MYTYVHIHKYLEPFETDPEQTEAIGQMPMPLFKSQDQHGKPGLTEWMHLTLSVLRFGRLCQRNET